MANIHLSGDVATTKAPKKEESYTSIDSGPYVAIVKQNYDPEKMGSIKVVIHALSKTTEPDEPRTFPNLTLEKMILCL